MNKRLVNLSITITLITSLIVNEHSYVFAMEDYLEKESNGENAVFDVTVGDFYFEEEDFVVTENNTYKVAVSENSVDTEKIEHDRILEYDNYIREYANYFDLDQDLVIEIARDFTNDYTYSEDFLINGKAYNILDKELFAMAIVYNIYMNADNYGISKKDIKLNNDVLCLNYNEDEIFLSNGYSFDSYVRYICDKVDVDSSLVLAIADYETGYLSSSQARYKNNFGGLKGGSGYITYPTPEAGIISMILNLDRIYEVYPINSLRDLSGAYVNGSISRPSDTWVYSVSAIQNDIQSEEEEDYSHTLK